MNSPLRLGLATALLLTTQCLHAAWPTDGGGNGKVVTVTSLAESGTGTLREALDMNGPRVIKFAVGGEIWLSDVFYIRNPFVTIDGTTAPAPGISLMGDRVRIRTHDVILRNVRLRVGARMVGTTPDNRDGLEVDGSDDGKSPSFNVLVENCSFSWAIDENTQVWGHGNHDIAFRNCIMAEGLRNSIHPKGLHSAGMVVGPGTTNLVIQGNLFADNSFRNPVLSAGSSGFVINNLIYNPGFAGFHVYGRDGVDAASILQCSVIGNVLKAGPDTRPKLAMFHEKGLNAGSKIYLEDNVATGTVAFDQSEVPHGWAAGSPSPFVKAPPIPLPGDLKVLPSAQVFDHVLATAGARPLDKLDKRLIEEVKSNSGSIKDAPTDSRLTVEGNYMPPGAPTPAP